MGPTGDTFTLSSKTTVSALTKRYPFLIDYLPTLSPHYEKLRNPVLRKTMGAIATMEKVASMGELDLEFLLSSIAGEIERQTGERVSVEGLAAPVAVSDEDRKAAMMAIIKDIHAGGDPEELKTRFADIISDISPSELAEVEQSLIDDAFQRRRSRTSAPSTSRCSRRAWTRGTFPACPGATRCTPT